MMRRRRGNLKNDEYSLPDSVVGIVVAVCGDYKRRADAVRRGDVQGDVLGNYIVLNSAVERGLAGIEVGLRANLLDDIARGCGYNHSAASLIISHGTYYKRKRQLIYDIAVAMRLVEREKEEA